MSSGADSGIRRVDIANRNGSAATGLTFLFQVAVRCHKSALLVVFCSLVGGDVWCLEAEHHCPPWARFCLRPVGEAALWVSAELGWCEAGGAARCRCHQRSLWACKKLGQAPEIILSGQQLQMLLQLNFYSAIVPERGIFSF